MKGKVVIITGGSSGIGKALADKYGREGSKVVITGRNQQKLDETAVWLSRRGIQCLAVQADSAIKSDNERMVAEVVQKWGGVDVLINNAGISMRALFEHLELSVFEKVMDINFWGTVYATKYALPYLLKSGGSVVGVSSIVGYKGTPARTAYSASKAAMQSFLEVLRMENMKKGLHVLVACPGFTSSNIRNVALRADGSTQSETPLDESKLMSAEKVADYIYDAVVKRKRDLILTRQGKMVVLLNKWFPSMMDRIVYNYMAKEKDSPFK